MTVTPESVKQKARRAVRDRAEQWSWAPCEDGIGPLDFFDDLADVAAERAYAASRARIVAWLRDCDLQNRGGEAYREDIANELADEIERGDYEEHIHNVRRLQVNTDADVRADPDL